MKVAIDSQTIRVGDKGRGIGFHTQLLIEHLKKFKDLDLELVDTKSVNLARYDLVHYPAFDTHLSQLPSIFNEKTVITIHDVIKLIYPKHYPFGVKGRLRFFQQKRRVQKADCIITISETSKKDIIRFLGIPGEKIKVIYLAPQPSTAKITTSLINQTKEKFNLADKFVLYIGGVNYNKNLLTLAKACKLAKLQLVMVGKETVNENFDRSNVENTSWVEFLSKYQRDINIKRLGFVEEHEKAVIWSLAAVYCQPSFYEGFGLPILEAFGHGCPIVASKTQALVEVGDDACLYVDPKSPQNMADGLIKILKDKKLSQELIKKGQQRLKNFSWEKTAQQTYKVYKSITGV